MLDGLGTSVRLSPYRNSTCEYKSFEERLPDGGPPPGYSLFFHSGPKDHPFVCAPHITPQNGIPIENLRIRARFGANCAIRDAFLEGCITGDAADHICMCMTSGSCSNPPATPPVPFDPTNLPKYCRDACGTGWNSFGSVVRTFGLFPTCWTRGGHAGYRLQGYFDAEEITAQFNPEQSSDCNSDR
jgi:hypothetical protein